MDWEEIKAGRKGKRTATIARRMARDPAERERLSAPVFYDRTLAAAAPRPRTIGIAFADAELPTIYPQPHDIPMDVIVTEQFTR
jgi:hypothetical protein